MNSKGTLFVLNRGYRPLGDGARLCIDRATGAAEESSRRQGPQWRSPRLHGRVLNDAAAASNGGIYFTMAGIAYAAPDGTVTKQDAKDGTGLAEGQGAGGDGSTFDANGRFYITAANGVQVFDKDGKHLGTIPASRNLVSVTIGGPQRKTLYSVTAAVVNGERKVWIESIPLLASGPKGRGK